MHNVIVTFVIFINVINSKDTVPRPRVTLKNGMVVIGTANITIDENKKYHAYRGIPFAEPPVGDLRFKPPVALSQNMSNVTFDASRDGSACMQLILPPIGSEDCLFISVYTSQFNPLYKPKPVILWIYGGFFMNGSNEYERYGPDYLLNENVVVVTFNYRVGVFGFMSTEDEHSPGNYGMQDQILALHWVQDNIEFFGGDKNKVTVYGESAGAVFVSYLTQNPNTKGLFHRVIGSSGLSICEWAITRNPKSKAISLAKALNIDFSSSKSIVDGLKKVDPNSLIEAQFDVITKEVILHNPLHGLPFGPTFEPPQNKSDLVPRYSYELMINGKFHQIPYLIGINSEEGLGLKQLIGLIPGPLILLKLITMTLVPISLNINDSKKDELNNIIYKSYFTRLQLQKRLLEFISDDAFNRPIIEAGLLLSKYTPVYFYQFSHVGPLATGTKSNKGVGHGEDLNYVWRRQDSHPATKGDLKARKRLVKLFTNFAKTGNPTPIADRLFQNVIWPPVDSSNNVLVYLDINRNIQLMKNPKLEQRIFWKHIFEEYGNGPYDTY